MAITVYLNRDDSQRDTQYLPVRIIKEIPGHPIGAIRRPNEAQRNRWLELGICEMVTREDLRALPVDETTASTIIRRKRGRPRGSRNKR